MDTPEVAAILQELKDVARDWELRAASRAEEIDDLSRELSEEIEAHRVTRERAESAEQRLADLVRGVEEWWDSNEADAIDLSVLLRKYRKPTEDTHG